MGPVALPSMPVLPARIGIGHLCPTPAGRLR